MNIHEHQAKDILKKFGAPVPIGVPIFALNEIDEKVKIIKTNKIVLKAQIHAGGRGKAGGVKVVDNIDKLKAEAKILLGKVLLIKQARKDEKLRGFISKKPQKYQKSFTFHV